MFHLQDMACLIDKLSKHITVLVSVTQISLHVCKQLEREREKKTPKQTEITKKYTSLMDDQNKHSLETDKMMCNLQPLKVSTLSESVFLYVIIIIVSTTTAI